MTKQGLGGGLIVAFVVAIAGAACGGIETEGVDEQQQGRQAGSDGATAAPEGSYVITIADMTFAPEDLAVPAGATVTVRNADSVPHSVTSAAAADSYLPSAVAGVGFDTGVFSQGERSFIVAAAAPSGTVVPYYCAVHKNAMKNAARITVR